MTAPERPMAPDRIRIEQHSLAGVIWIWAWLFTIGLLHLSFWKGLLGVLLWPYYLGVAFAPKLLS